MTTLDSPAAEKAVGASDFVLDRAVVVPELIGRHEDFLIVTGLGSSGTDIATLAGADASHVYCVRGAMGSAASTALGLALAQPRRAVLLVTTEGELLMNIGTLVTIAAAAPVNLSILCVDNGHYGETGNQLNHTSMGADLQRIADGAGIPYTAAVRVSADIERGAAVLRKDDGVAFVVVRVNMNRLPIVPRTWDGSIPRVRFRAALGIGEQS